MSLPPSSPEPLDPADNPSLLDAVNVGPSLIAAFAHAVGGVLSDPSVPPGGRRIDSRTGRPNPGDMGWVVVADTDTDAPPDEPLRFFHDADAAGRAAASSDDVWWAVRLRPVTGLPAKLRDLWDAMDLPRHADRVADLRMVVPGGIRVPARPHLVHATRVCDALAGIEVAEVKLHPAASV